MLRKQGKKLPKSSQIKLTVKIKGINLKSELKKTKLLVKCIIRYFNVTEKIRSSDTNNKIKENKNFLGTSRV